MSDTLGGLIDKVCRKCLVLKPVYDYYVQKRWLHPYCKDCVKADAKKWKSENKEKALKIGRRACRKHYAANAEAMRSRPRRRQLKPRDPAAHRAHVAVWYAVSRGRLFRPSKCQQCGLECKPEAHHASYDKRLEVEWLCRSCHAKTWRKEA